MVPAGHPSAQRCGLCLLISWDPGSAIRAVVDVSAMVDVEDVDGTGAFVDAVHDPVSSAPGTVTAGERPEQWLAHTVRVDGERGVTELQHGCGDGLWPFRGGG